MPSPTTRKNAPQRETVGPKTAEAKRRPKGVTAPTSSAMVKTDSTTHRSEK